MPTIYLDSAISDEKRRHRLYAGDLYAFSAGDSATKLAELARDLSEAAFAPHDPQVAQESMPPERYVDTANSPSNNVTGVTGPRRPAGPPPPFHHSPTCPASHEAREGSRIVWRA